MRLLRPKWGIFDNLTGKWLIAEFDDGSAMWAHDDEIDWDDGPMVFARRRFAEDHITATFEETGMLVAERIDRWH